MPPRNECSEAASATDAFVDACIDAAVIKFLGHHPKQLAGAAEKTNKTIPDVPVHPVGKFRCDSGKGDYTARVEFVQPHPVSQESKQPRLCAFQRIDLGYVAIDQECSCHPAGNKSRRDQNK